MHKKVGPHEFSRSHLYQLGCDVCGQREDDVQHRSAVSVTASGSLAGRIAEHCILCRGTRTWNGETCTACIHMTEADVKELERRVAALEAILRDMPLNEIRKANYQGLFYERVHQWLGRIRAALKESGE